MHSKQLLRDLFALLLYCSVLFFTAPLYAADVVTIERVDASKVDSSLLGYFISNYKDLAQSAMEDAGFVVEDKLHHPDRTAVYSAEVEITDFSLKRARSKNIITGQKDPYSDMPSLKYDIFLKARILLKNIQTDEVISEASSEITYTVAEQEQILKKHTPDENVYGVFHKHPLTIAVKRAFTDSALRLLASMPSSASSVSTD